MQTISRPSSLTPALIGQEAVPHPLELVHRGLVVVVAADVEPVVLVAAPRPHHLARVEQAQDEVGEVEPLAALDLLERPRREGVDAHADLVAVGRLLDVAGEAVRVVGVAELEHAERDLHLAAVGGDRWRRRRRPRCSSRNSP